MKPERISAIILQKFPRLRFCRQEGIQVGERIYITHCSAKKDDTLRGRDIRVPPDKLYTATPLRRFVETCKSKGVEWAIFSDKYGVVFPQDRIAWYDKHPDTVTPSEFRSLVDNFIERLSGYREIWFYHNPGRFHPLYERLVKEARKRGLIVRLFTHLYDIR